jgi:rRNA maturation protein Nop10
MLVTLPHLKHAIAVQSFLVSGSAGPMTISFACPHCGRNIRVGDKAAGQSGTCNGCGKKIRVPHPEGAAFVPDLPVHRVDVSPGALKAGFFGGFGAYFGKLAASLITCVVLAVVIFALFFGRAAYESWQMRHSFDRDILVVPPNTANSQR